MENYEELKDRIILTLGLLLVYRFGAQVVLPGIDASQLGGLANSTDQGLLGLLMHLLVEHLLMLLFLL